MYTLTIHDERRNKTKSIIFSFYHQTRTWSLLNGFFDHVNPFTHESTTLTRIEMAITTRDLFNYINPALMYKNFLKREGLEDGLLDVDHEYFNDVLADKAAGQLEGEQHSSEEGQV